MSDTRTIEILSRIAEINTALLSVRFGPEAVALWTEKTALHTQLQAIASQSRRER